MNKIESSFMRMDYEFDGHVFERGVTTIVWTYGCVTFTRCDARAGAIIVLAGNWLNIGKWNNFHPSAVIQGNVGRVDCRMRAASVLKQLRCDDMFILAEKDWPEEDLDMLGSNAVLSW